MRVLFDGTTLCGTDGGLGAGIEHYTVFLLRALLAQATDDLFLVSLPKSCPVARPHSLIGSYKNVRFLPPRLPRIPFVSRHLLLPVRSAVARADLFFSPFGQLPFFWRGCPGIITVHDVSIFDHPEWFADEVVQSFTTRRLVPASYEHASVIICVSAFTQSRLHVRFPFTKRKTTIVHEGVESGQHREVEYRERFPFDRDYILCLGTIEPRKNLVHAFLAFEQFLQIHPELSTTVRLVVAGKRGWKTQEAEETARRINEKQEVIHFLGSVTEEEKWYLLSRASALLFPSYEEGFGLSVLEAMSVGTPVIAGATGAIPEVAGDCAILVDPCDIEAMALSIAQCVLVPEGVQSLREEGYRRAQQFTWDRTARETLTIFQSLVLSH